jgi:hypothetical protein
VPELHPPLDPGYRVELFTEQSAVSQEDVIDVWEREGVVDPGTASRRVHEVLLVGVDEHDELAAVSSAYLKRNLRLRMDLWYYRTYTVREHRMSNVGVLLALRSRDHLEHRFATSKDPRGAGLAYEVQNAGLRTHADAFWFPIDIPFLGENERGDHLRVRYFPGARAPGPPE